MLPVMPSTIFFPCSIQSDCKLLRESEYNSVFLSMYPIDTYDEEDFRYFRGDDVLKLTTVITRNRIMTAYLKEIIKSDNELRVLYLGIDPKRTGAAHILQIRDMFPGVQIEVIPAYRPLSEWLRDSKSEDTLQAYYDLTNYLVDQENIRVFSFFAQEWLIADPENYEKGLLLKKNVARLLYTYTDDIHDCQFTRQEIPVIFDELKELLATAKAGKHVFADLSDWDIVFIGDSVFGNFTDHLSIPGYVSGFSNAHCYNCGWGGACASGDMPSSGIKVISDYLKGIIPTEVPEGAPVADSLKQLLEDEAKGSPRKKLYVLHYGLNDYYLGRPLESQDPYDPETYVGAMRGIIEALQTNRPDAQILIVLPNPVLSFNNGKKSLGENGSPLQSYVEALRGLAQEYSIPYQDDYSLFPSEKLRRMLSDETHPNEYGRYLIAKKMIEVISQQY